MTNIKKLSRIIMQEGGLTSKIYKWWSNLDQKGHLFTRAGLCEKYYGHKVAMSLSNEKIVAIYNDLKMKNELKDIEAYYRQLKIREKAAKKHEKEINDMVKHLINANKTARINHGSFAGKNGNGQLESDVKGNFYVRLNGKTVYKSSDPRKVYLKYESYCNQR